MSRGEFVMSGYLTKSPPESKIKVAQWHRRWFLLMDSRLVYPLADRYVRLEYYQSEVEAKRLADPKGIINLKSCTEVKERDPIKGYKFAFDICTEERVYHLASETERERQEWLSTLNNLLFDETHKQNGRERRHSPTQTRADIVRRIKQSATKLQRPLSFTGSPTNTANRTSPISSRPLPSLPITKQEERKSRRPLPPTPVADDPSLAGVHIHHLGPQKSPLPARRKKKEPPPRPVPFHLTHPASSPVPPVRSTSQPSAVINDHYEVGPGQQILVTQNNSEKISPKPRRKVPQSKSLDESHDPVMHINITTNGGRVGLLADLEGDDEYSLLQSEPPTYNSNNDDYSHLSMSNDRGSPPPPPPPVRHSSKQNSNSISYENLTFIPAARDEDYCHLKHT